MDVLIDSCHTVVIDTRIYHRWLISKRKKKYDRDLIAAVSREPWIFITPLKKSHTIDRRAVINSSPFRVWKIAFNSLLQWCILFVCMRVSRVVGKGLLRLMVMFNGGGMRCSCCANLRCFLWRLCGFWGWFVGRFRSLNELQG